MTRILALLLVAVPVLAVDPNPESLKLTETVLKQAEALVQLLGSDSYRERDTASQQLAKLGRKALPAVEAALDSTENAEVRERCELLRPAMRQEDIKARLEVFQADVAGKYDHKLPGWAEFRKAVGNTTESRAVYTDLYFHPTAANLLSLIDGPKADLMRAVGDRKLELYQKLFGRNRFVAINGVQAERTPSPPADVLAILLAETIAADPVDRRGYMTSILTQQGVRELFVADDAKGMLQRKLLVAWCDSRTDCYDAYTAMTVATNISHKDLPVRRYANNVLQSKNLLPTYASYALNTLAKQGPDAVPDLEKYFDNTTKIPTFFYTGLAGAAQRIEIPIRDAALGLAIVASGEKPADYGFQVTGRPVTEANKYTFNYYRLDTDEKRDAAFKKWSERLKK